MKCSEVLACISEYVDKEVCPDSCSAIEEHLAKCSHCRAQVQTITQTVTLVRRMKNCCAQKDMVIRLQRRIVRIDRGKL